jgi:EmrB/QacA subfamily drug resistance transporter
MSAATPQPCDEGVIRGPDLEAEAPCDARSKRWVLVTLILASSMVFIDGTVVNVALPALQREFHATIQQAQWVVESYALLLAALLLPGGAAADRFGRKRVFALGAALFGAASLWCALVGSIEQLVLARALQGVGGALLVPGSLAIISASFPKSERGRAIGTWSGFTAMTAATGPVLGGWLIDHLSWRYAFLINLPLSIAVLLLTWRHVPESRSEKAGARLDWPGALLASAGLGGVVYGLIESPQRGWGDPTVSGALALGLVALAAFVAVERRHPSPMLPLDLFRSRDFSGANLLTLLLYAALGATLFFLPLNLIQVQGYATAVAGAALLPFTLIMFVLSRWAGGLVDRYGAKGPLVIGPAIAALGFALFAVPGVGGSYWSSFFPAVVVLGLGMSVAVAPLTTTVMSAVDAASSGIASGVNNAVSRTAGLLAIAALGAVMSGAFSFDLERRLERLPAPPEARQAVLEQRHKLAAIEIPSGLPPESRQALSQTVAQSFVFAFRWVMLISALLAAASAVSAWRMIGGRKPGAHSPP